MLPLHVVQYVLFNEGIHTCSLELVIETHVQGEAGGGALGGKR